MKAANRTRATSDNTVEEDLRSNSVVLLLGCMIYKRFESQENFPVQGPDPDLFIENDHASSSHREQLVC
jgi:hypothetical protein